MLACKKRLQGTLLSCLLFIGVLSRLEAETLDEHQFKPLRQGSYSKTYYFNELGLPNIYESIKTRPNCQENCSYPVVLNAKNRVLKRYPSSYNITRVASGRYEGIAYLQYKLSYPCGDKTCSSRILMDNNGRTYTPRSSIGGAKDALISKNRMLYEVAYNGLYKDARLILEAPNDLEEAGLGNNPQGDIAVVAVDASGQVYGGSLDAWMRTDLLLADHGDRYGILDVYPQDSKTLYLTLYKYVNIYNKGLVAAKVDFAKNSTVSGWVFNSGSRNVGFDPEIYIDESNIYITATDSSHSSRKGMAIPKDTFDEIGAASNYPQGIIGYEQEELMTFLVGAGAAYYLWNAKTSVEKDSTDYAQMDYDISNSIYWSLYFEGRVGNVRLGLSYLKNEAEKIGGLAGTATKVFNLFFDYAGLFSDSSSIRVGVERAEVNGMATYSQKSTNGVISLEPSQSHEFRAILTRYWAKLMMERGFFAALEYAAYTTPSAVGFSGQSKNMEYVTFDKKLKIEDYMLLVGYDELSYSRRYESDYAQFFLQGHVGLGFGNLNLSSETKSEVETALNKSVKGESSFIFDAEVNVGYLWQSRFKNIHGFGYAITAGLKGRGSWQGSGQSTDSDQVIPEDELRLEFDRYDIWYGPYTTFNLIF